MLTASLINQTLTHWGIGDHSPDPDREIHGSGLHRDTVTILSEVASKDRLKIG